MPPHPLPTKRVGARPSAPAAALQGAVSPAPQHLLQKTSPRQLGLDTREARHLCVELQPKLLRQQKVPGRTPSALLPSWTLLGPGAAPLDPGGSGQASGPWKGQNRAAGSRLPQKQDLDTFKGLRSTFTQQTEHWLRERDPTGTSSGPS